MPSVKVSHDLCAIQTLGAFDEEIVLVLSEAVLVIEREKRNKRLRARIEPSYRYHCDITAGHAPRSSV